MTNRLNLLVAVALAASAFACDRNSDNNKASETNTTSANVTPKAADQAGAPAPVITEQTTPSEAVTTTPTFRAKDAGASGAMTTGATTGVSTGTQTNGQSTPNGGTAPPDNGGVAPGHIMFPPEKGPGTGEPNSAGSHNLGSGKSR